MDKLQIVFSKPQKKCLNLTSISIHLLRSAQLSPPPHSPTCYYIQSMLFQVVYNITGWDTRTVLTWGALVMHIYILDLELEEVHKWHEEGGSEAFIE